ncbi:MAG: serine/threonine-protein kinase [Kofleriaceae bacterium]
MTIPAGTLVPRDARGFGSYELIAKIATGGMAEIFLARSLGGSAAGAAGEHLVVKRILPHLAEDEHFVTMFRDEADLASRLVHPNVCRVYTLGHHDATWFIAMEYLHGVPLSRMLSKLAKRKALVDFRIVAALICQACDGLHHAHEVRDERGTLLGVVHRDVSPPNIMLVAEGTVKLLDFGIAKARGANSRTRTGTVKGKNAYMSPEQILGKPLDRRSDVFALGAVMYELLAVRRLFHRESDFLTFRAITEDAVPDIRDRRPDIPAGLRDALNRSLARDPSGRFATARAFGEAVRQSVAELGGPATVAELAAYLKAEFADELEARDELLAAAAAPAPMGGPAVDVHTAQTVPAGEVLELEAIGGELLATVVEGQALRDSDLPEAVPSMIVSTGTGPVPALRTGPSGMMPAASTPAMPAWGGAGRVSTPLAVPVTPGAPPPPPSLTPPQGPAMRGGPDGPMPMGFPAAPGFPGLPDGPTTDILRAYRRKNLRNTLLLLAGFGAVVALIIVVAGAREDKPPVAPVAAVAAEPDAAPTPDAEPEPPDADQRADIIAMSKFGFFSVDSTASAEIFVNNVPIGETPITRVPLRPGVHKVRAKGPRGKVQTFEVTIYGAKDTDSGLLTW